MAKTVWTEEAERNWPQYEGDMDAALASLRETDRKAVLLRFYEHKTFDEIAAILGTAEEAARKRVSRAVEKLRGYFGVSTRTLPATMLTYYLYSKLSVQAPAGLAEQVAAAAISPATAATIGTSALADQVVSHISFIQAKWVATSVAAAAVFCIAAGAVIFTALPWDPPGSQQTTQMRVEPERQVQR
jgi:hypothetical protein